MSNRSSIGHMPEGPWAFDDQVAAVFDDMIERSIPQYVVMREAVDSVAARFLMREATAERPRVVVDLGCSTGISIARLAPRADRFIGVESSGSMLEQARARFSGQVNVQILEMDLRRDFPMVENVDVVLSVLTLQFVPIEHRSRVLRAARDSLREGGALVIVEKTIGSSAETQAMFVDLYHRLKERNGYSREEIDRKALSLEGRLVPLTEAGNVELLRGAGFRVVECFWRWMSFAAWVAIR